MLLSIISSSLYYNTVLVDTQAYVPSVYYMQDKQLQDDDVVRVTESYAFKRPVEILFATLLEPFIGVRQSYSLMNVFIVITTTFLVYFYAKKLLKEEATAYISAVLFAVSLPIILYATRVLVDVAGYLILIFGLLAGEWVFDKKEIQWYHHACIALLFGVSLLVRDTVIILFPYYIMRYVYKEGFRKILSLWPLVCAIIPQLLFMWWFQVGFLLSGKSSAITAGKYSLLGWLKFFIVHIAAFHILYVFAYLGLRNETKEICIKHGMYAISALTYLVGIQLVALTSPRFSMVLFPVLIPLAAVGIVHIAKKTSRQNTILLLCILVYALISFLGAWLYPAHTMIAEDAGGNVVIQAIINEIQHKIGGLL
jgi:hypothetical protein